MKHNMVYRFVLPSHANKAARREFHQKIEIIRQTNPDWVLVREWPQYGETEAFLLLFISTFPTCYETPPSAPLSTANIPQVKEYELT